MNTKKGGALKLSVEAGSALAVLLGLVFVGLELRQNTAAVEAATFQAITDASSGSLLARASSDELMRISLKADTDFDGLTEEERYRLFYLDRSNWVRYQNAYSQWQRGTLTDEDWQLYSAVVCDEESSWKERFENHRIILSQGLQSYVDACLAAYSSE
ncbi:hypothetical protein R0135_14235 [Congregibacter variabilis]|uniref:Uncharacterized protein n=1 Tax=Congregibacter variabilis TaxID=3081200 RepID=A0ABZ0I185_9GAMM|nr:hypothetical protein R0135_14235 [Congregibacter sp. IMCC43200]